MIVLITFCYMVIALALVIIGYFVWHWLKRRISIMRGKWILIKAFTIGSIKEKSYSKLYLIFVILFASNDTTDLLMKEAIKSSEAQERKEKELGGPSCE